MAFSAVTERGSASSKVSDTILDVSPSAALTVGKIVFAVFASNNIATTDGASTNHTTVTDTDGHTWTKVAERTNTEAAAAADGVTGSLWWTRVTSQIGTGDVITLTTSGALTARVVGVFEVTVGTGNTILLADSTFIEDDTSNLPALTLSGLASKEYLFIGVAWRETDLLTWGEDADYTNVYAAEGVGSTGGGSATNVAINVGTRIATLTGDTFDVGGLSATQNIGALFAFEEVTTGTPHAATKTDPLGLTDSIVVVHAAAHAATKTDPLGLTDSGSADRLLVGDPLGLTDSIVVVHETGTAHSQTRTDPLGLTDTVVVVHGVAHSQTVTDLLGLTDSVTAEEGGHSQTVTDLLGLTDMVVVSHTVGVVVVGGTVTLSDLWVHEFSDFSNFVRVYAGSMTEEVGVSGEVRRYANGVVRAITTVGSRRRLAVVLPYIDRDDLATLEGWAGQSVMVRDPLGRKVFGIFFQVDIEEAPLGDVSLVRSASFDLAALSLSEEV